MSELPEMSGGRIADNFGGRKRLADKAIQAVCRQLSAMSASKETLDLQALVECRQIVGNVGTAFADMPTTPYKKGVVVGEPGFWDTWIRFCGSSRASR